jgi:beta-barrel assembly-enhancing protease
VRTLSARILTVSLIALIAAPVFAGDDKNKKNDPSQIGDRDVGKCLNFYSVEKEMALGKQLAEEVAREAKVVDDPILSEYVNRIGQNLARNSDAKVPFTFRLLQNDVPNAFALPGGYIFVHTGLIGIAAEEDEFAGALAHEIAHVAARHLTCRETKAQLANIGTIPLSILLGGWAGVAARQAAGAAIPMTFLSFSRHDESEADFLGVQYMWAAGYDPTGAISMFEKLETLQRTQPTAVSKLLSTHPMDSDRITKTQAEIDKILPSKPEYIVTTSDYTNMRQRLLTMENRRKPDDPNKPQLRRAPGVDDPDKTGDDGRPTLKRRDLTQ